MEEDNIENDQNPASEDIVRTDISDEQSIATDNSVSPEVSDANEAGTGVLCEKRLSAVESQIALCLQLIKEYSEKNNQGNETLERSIKEVMDAQNRCESKIVQNLKENSEFRYQVRQGMQHELDELKKQQSGEHIIPILKEIAAIYSDYHFMLGDEEFSPKMKKNLSALFEQIADLLSEYGAEVSVSMTGTPRNVRSTKIIHTIPSENQSQHNTVARSLKPGIIKDKIVLAYETVDVFVHSAGTNGDSAKSN